MYEIWQMLVLKIMKSNSFFHLSIKADDLSENTVKAGVLNHTDGHDNSLSIHIYTQQ